MNMSLAELSSVNETRYELNLNEKSILNKDDFLRLLLTQIKNQDPLNPLKNTEFTAQLAQLSSLEQLRHINENLGSLQNFQALLNDFQTVNFIGKYVEAAGSSFVHQEGNSSPLRFELAEDAKKVFIYIYDNNGELIKNIEKENLVAGNHTVTWDGTDKEGREVPGGSYSFEVFATDETDEEIATQTLIAGIVEEVKFNGNGAWLVVDGQEVPVNKILKVSESEDNF